MIFGTTHLRAIGLWPPELPGSEPYLLAGVAAVLPNFTSGNIEVLANIIIESLFTTWLSLFTKNVLASLLAGRAG
jgi:hypothetical protein